MARKSPLGPPRWSSSVALGLRPTAMRWQDVLDGDPADFPAADHDGHGLPLREGLGRPVSLRARRV